MSPYWAIPWGYHRIYNGLALLQSVFAPLCTFCPYSMERLTDPVLYRNIETETDTRFQFHGVLYQFYAKRFNMF